MGLNMTRARLRSRATPMASTTMGSLPRKLLAASFFRELLGSGTLFGVDILGRLGYVTNNLVILPPFALILLGCIVWVQRSIQKDLQEK